MSADVPTVDPTDPADLPAIDAPVAVPEGADADPQEVRRLTLLDGREIILVGTAHISRSSVELVHRVIEREMPDCVCVELDEKRYEALSQKDQWEQLDIKQVIRNKQFATLMVNLLLATYQKRMGAQLGVQPGQELLEATQVAKEHEIPIHLCDRDVRVTLRRAISATPLWRRLILSAELLASIFDSPKLTEEELHELKQQDVLNELMGELGRQLPSLKTVLIDERDGYLATKIQQAPGRKIVAVVGAGHLQGICDMLDREEKVDLGALDVIPPVSPMWKIIGWSVPLLILGSIGWIGWKQGLGAAGDNALYWVLANGIPSSLGGVLALAHPLVILTAFVVAPITSLSPLIGAGYVCVFVQAMLVPPVVKEFQTLGDDVVQFKRWWQSKLLRLFLTFVLTGWGSLLGSVLGIKEIVGNLLEEPVPCVYAAAPTGADAGAGFESHPECALASGDGSFTLLPEHLAALDFGAEDRAEVLIEGRWHYAAPSGSLVAVPTYDNGPDTFAEGLVRTLVDDKIGFVDEALRLVIPARYDWAWPFEGGRALACLGCTFGEPDADGHREVRGGLWGYLGPDGSELVPIRLSRAEAESR